jgi:hypothetical protein
MTKNDKKWMKVGSKWKCKVGIYIITCVAKMVVDQTFKGGAWLCDKKGQTWEAFNF